MRWTTHALATFLLLPTPAFAAEPGPAPDAPTVAEPATEMNSVGMAIAGGIMSGLGTLILVGSAVVYAEETKCNEPGLAGAISCEIESELQSGVEEPALIGAMVVGAVHVAVGIPLLVAGVWRVPLDGSVAAADAIVRDPELRIGPGSLGLRLRF